MSGPLVPRVRYVGGESGWEHVGEVRPSQATAGELRAALADISDREAVALARLYTDSPGAFLAERAAALRWNRRAERAWWRALRHKAQADALEAGQ